MISEIVVRYSLTKNYAVLISQYSIVKKDFLIFILFGIPSMLRYLKLFMLLNSRSPLHKI